ncbi:peptidoglycan DD-metalloendopeptidase family protein [Pseudidiomarina taiwanensis]|uniref:Peptidase M23 n=1 Tax=Pseudidiomarina taiwanensis TaxID=337250 RepID=A0A432ZNJ1_9GAMM|nr:peptidoglycan DD-metalloendopeptidase family protein [Pseudidiomarina taiwanensis]RUO79447.1 peptidase M23 [Pseudidiomarina taiwanensis]
MDGHWRQQKALLAIIIAPLLLVACSQSDGERAPVKRIYTGKTIHDFEPASLKQARYTVERGDTLYSIAFRANIDIRTIATLNQLQEPYTIYPGQELILHRSGAVSTGKTSQNSSQAVIASESNNEYVETQSTQKIKNPRPIVLPRAVENYPASKDIAWQWPAQTAVISEFSPTEVGSKGLAFAGTEQTSVYAAAAGKVVYAGNALKGYGNLIIVKHNDDYITAYAHNSALLVGEQDWVQAGEEIAKMGNTDAERIKLHFEVRFKGKSVNPRHYLPKGK